MCMCVCLFVCVPARVGDLLIAMLLMSRMQQFVQVRITACSAISHPISR